MLKYLLIFVAISLFIPQQSSALMLASYNDLTKELLFISTSFLDCDSSQDTYYLQTYIMNNDGPYYMSTETGLPIPEDAWTSYYGGGSYVAPYIEVFDASTLSPGTYYAFTTCVSTQVNPSEFVPGHTPFEFTVTE